MQLHIGMACHRIHVRSRSWLRMRERLKSSWSVINTPLQMYNDSNSSIQIHMFYGLRVAKCNTYEMGLKPEMGPLFWRTLDEKKTCPPKFYGRSYSSHNCPPPFITSIALSFHHFNFFSIFFHSYSVLIILEDPLTFNIARRI